MGEGATPESPPGRASPSSLEVSALLQGHTAQEPRSQLFLPQLCTWWGDRSVDQGSVQNISSVTMEILRRLLLCPQRLGQCLAQ